MLFQLQLLSVPSRSLWSWFEQLHLTLILTLFAVSLTTVKFILCNESRWLLSQVLWKSRWWAVWVGGGCLLCWSFPKAVMAGRGIPNRAAWVDHSVLTSLLGFPDEAVVLLPKITWMELTGRDHSRWVGNSPTSHGSRGCWTLWMGNHDTCCTPGLACSAWFGGDWPWSPHSRPPSSTKGSRLCHWSGKGNPGHVSHQSHNLGGFWRGYYTKKTSELLVKIVEHSLLVSILWVQPMMLESHGWKCPVGWHSWPSAKISLRECGCHLWWNCRNVLRRIPSWPLLPGQSTS